MVANNMKINSELLKSYFVEGVVSTTITWNSTLGDYIVTNPVRGIISQDLINRAASYGVAFNASTGYFEVNGLTDISRTEMEKMLAYAIVGNEIKNGTSNSINGILSGVTTRTNLIGFQHYSSDNLYLYYFALYGELSIIALDQTNVNRTVTFRQAFNNRFVRTVLGVIDCRVLTGTGAAPDSFYSSFGSNLRDIQLKNIKASCDLSKCSYLTNESILYAVQNETSTSAITFTLHADAYARAIADDDVQAALTAHPNVTLASA